MRRTMSSAAAATALKFEVIAKCKKTRARVGVLRLKKTTNCFDDAEKEIKSINQDDEYLPDSINTPVFMPVGTNGTMKGLLPEQVESTGCRLMLSNTYHLGIRPGVETIKEAGGLHNFMKWPHGLLTDSGGFQMVSLSKLMEVKEEGVTFTSPYDYGKVLNLPPEESIRIQHGLGSNIVMQLDDVISSTANDEKRYEEAVDRTVRCIETNASRAHKQNLFPIIQGGLNEELRRKCVKEMLKRDTPGIAIGGLSGGEEKAKFVSMVAVSTESLPDHKPRYLMGVGFAVDLLLCSALGCDMFDCVYPTRTARFGTALVGNGVNLDLEGAKFKLDFGVLDTECDCTTCSKGYSRSFIRNLMKQSNPVGCHLLTVHNIRFQMRFMTKIRTRVMNGTFVEFMREALDEHFGSKDSYPDFARKTFELLDIEL